MPATMTSRFDMPFGRPNLKPWPKMKVNSEMPSILPTMSEIMTMNVRALMTENRTPAMAKPKKNRP